MKPWRFCFANETRKMDLLCLKCQPRFPFGNKLDNLSEYQRQDVEEAAKRINSKNKSNKVFIVSARTSLRLGRIGKGLESVLAEKTLRRVELRVPFSESSKLIGEFRKVGVVEREEWDEENALIVALVPISMAERRCSGVLLFLGVLVLRAMITIVESVNSHTYKEKM